MAASESEPFRFDGEGDYVEHRRQKSIYDARKMARDVILEAKRQHSRNQIPAETLQTDARAAVETYITEVEHIANKAGADDLLNTAEIHTIQLEPPEDLMVYVNQDEHAVLTETPGPKVPTGGHITGLWGFMTAPDVFSANWTIDVEVRHEGPRDVTETASTRMPVEASMDAFRHVNLFLEMVGLDLEPSLEAYDGGDEPGL